MSSELEKMRAARKDGCLSDFAIDALVADDVDEAKASAHEAHFASCAECRARFEARKREAAEFAENAPALLMPKRNTRENKPVSTSATGWVVALSVISMAAGLLFYIRTKQNPIVDDGASTRLKGTSHIGFFVKRGDAVVQGTNGENVKPGDALRFTYSTSAPGYLAILSVDGAKNASVYYPDGPRAVAIAPGREQALDASTVLDDTLGHETLYALFCDKPVALDPIREALEASPDHAPSVEGCTVDTATIEKSSATP